MKTFTQRALALLLTCGLALSANAQFVAIPAGLFRNYLQLWYPGCIVGNTMDTTCAGIVNATTLDVSNRQITNVEGVQYFDNLQTFSCFNNLLTTLPLLPNSLEVLNCYDNPLTSMTALPNSLKILNCYDNQLTSLPALSSSLEILHCYNNQLTSLPALPSSLEILHCYDNQLTSLPSLPSSLDELYCDVNQLTSLPALPNYLGFLSCSNNHLTSLPALPNNIGYISCGSNPLTSLPTLPTYLGTLFCGNGPLASLPTLPSFLSVLNCNQASITTLPALPNSLLYLTCSNNNQLTSLPALPNSLLKLTCIYNNQLSSLPTMPNSLVELYCNNNQLTSLPTLSNSLNYLYCQNNQLTSLSVLPNSLTYINCCFNQLTSLPALPNSLTGLSCYQNQLTNLPTLPSSLTRIGCSHNQLTSLPALSNTFEYLDCSYNQLTSLPALPNTMTNLVCSFNQLTSLPALPNPLYELECENNQISTLPELPDLLDRFYCQNNQLTCIPVLPSGLYNYNAANNPASCIPNMPQFCPTCQAYPLCDISEICINENALCTGKIFLDLNGNTVLDNGENIFSNVVLGATPGNHASASAYWGYWIALDTNTTSTVTTSNPYPFALYCAPPSHSVASGGPGIIPGSFDFAMIPIPNIHDLEVVVSNGLARPGFDTWADIRVTNAGTVIDSPLITFDFPSDWVVLGTNPQGTVNGNTITWQDAALGIFQHHNFQVQLNVPAFVPLGTPYSYVASVPAAGDVTPYNNTFTANGGVTGAYDPNDKACNTENLYTGYGSDTELLYTIRFQNTGNYPAETVVLRDTLSPLLQANTLRLVNASHPRCDLSFMDNARALSFIFPNINLLDSFTNEPLSHGFVQYAIKPQPGLPIGTIIENTADIYFDYNAPVRTNTTGTSVDLVGVPQVAGEGALRVYPNPTGGQLRVEAPQPLGGAAQLLVYDMTGRAMIEAPFVGSGLELSLERLAAGVYTLALVQDGRVLFRGMVLRR